MLGHNKNINAGETFTTMATVPTLLAMFQCSSCLGYVIGVQKGPPSKEVRPPHSYHIVVALNLFVWQTECRRWIHESTEAPWAEGIVQKIKLPGNILITSCLKWLEISFSGSSCVLWHDYFYLQTVGCIILFSKWYPWKPKRVRVESFSNDFKMPERYDLWGSISTLHLVLEWCYVQHDRIVKMTRPMQDERTMNHIYI